MTPLYPALGSVWMDTEGRELTVHAVVPGDPGGREVRGRIITGGEERDYAADQRTWAAVWRDRQPRSIFRT